MTDEPVVLHFRQLEERMTNPEIRRCPEELSRLLADDFREFGSSGRIFNKQQIIEELQNQTPVQISIDEFQMTWLARNIALVTYRGNCRFLESDKVSQSLRSSIWRKENERWEVVFHQGTPSQQSAQHG
jgi:hypothetical protein